MHLLMTLALKGELEPSAQPTVSGFGAFGAFYNRVGHLSRGVDFKGL